MSELVETYRGAIYPWQCDHMGHMNVMWYVGKFDEATWNLFAMAGLTAAFLKENRRGMAAVQQNITYKRELHAGDTIAVRSGFMEVREKTAKFVHEMRDAVTGEVSSICVLTAVHTDSQTRKSCPFPSEIVRRARDLVRRYDVTST
jgi:acyl-CoA thioester hydrolase